VSGNLDAPEGGLDAVMQAITCEVSKSAVRYVFFRLFWMISYNDSREPCVHDGKVTGLLYQ
jgi:hypothetical protein